MNRLSGVIGLTNLMLFAAGVLFGGAMILPKYERTDAWYYVTWGLCAALSIGAIWIQVRVMGQKNESKTEDDYKVSGHVQRYSERPLCPHPPKQR